MLALLSDIHANLHALEACLGHAQAQGATRLAFLGDLVGYGAQPRAVVDRIMTLAQAGAIVLQGNHDALAVRGGGGPTLAESGAGWTHEQLAPAQRDFLGALPLTALVGEALLVHATADAPAAWHYATQAPRVSRSLVAAATHPGVRHVFGGHVHHQQLWFAGRRGKPMAFAPTPGAAIALARHRHWLATIGSVGQPRDGDTRAAYALWDSEAATPRLTFHRVHYDHLAAADAVARSGLPAAFAQRLRQGR